MTAILTPTRQTFRPIDLARKYGCAVGKILRFIAAGELCAIDISQKRDKKPRWVIVADAVESFERARSNAASLKRSLHRRQARKEVRPEGFMDFFPEQ
jgi:hypothetical protein